MIGRSEIHQHYLLMQAVCPVLGAWNPTLTESGRASLGMQQVVIEHTIVVFAVLLGSLWLELTASWKMRGERMQDALSRPQFQT